MRIAVLSDIHGNITALEAVLTDIRNQSPDLIYHGGDIADAGSGPLEVLDQIRDLGFPGVLGNTDEMLIRPEALDAFAAHSKAPPALWDQIRVIAAATRAALGQERLDWLRTLPLAIEHPVSASPGLALVHAQPRDCWRAPAADATDADLEAIYATLHRPFVVYGHTHVPGVRQLNVPFPKLLINTGSVGLPYDGDPRASYLILDNDMPTIRRVEYDVEKELQLLATYGLPGADWTAKMLRARRPAMP